MARLDDEPYPWKTFDDYEAEGLDWKEATNLELQAYQALLDASDALPEGELKGKVVSWGRGDGAAIYVVTKLRPLTLSWVPFLDAWQVEDALIRGLTRQDIIDMVSGDILFGKSKHAKRAW